MLGGSTKSESRRLMTHCISTYVIAIYLNVTDGQTDERLAVASRALCRIARGKLRV